MDRRSFLRRSALLLPAIVVGEEALEALERLTHRKVFLGVDFANGRDRTVRTGLPPVQWRGLNDRPVTATEIREAERLTLVDLAKRMDDVRARTMVEIFSRSNRLLAEMPWRIA